MGLRAIIFDIDGVLADSSKAVVHNTETLLREFGFPFEHESVLKMSRAHSADTVLLSLAPELEQDGAKLKAMLKRLSELTQENMGLITPLPLAPHIPKIAARYLLAAATNRKGSAGPVLERLGVRQYFPVVMTSADAKAKPAPDMVVMALAKLGVKANEAMFVGDNEEDMQAGRAAGTKTLMLDGSDSGACGKFLKEIGIA
ncbi:MAG: HAD-IA family hydrolase [Candidatus Anstonellaceae archaeon]